MLKLIDPIQHGFSRLEESVFCSRAVQVFLQQLQKQGRLLSPQLSYLLTAQIGVAEIVLEYLLLDDRLI